MSEKDAPSKKNPFELQSRSKGPARTYVAKQWTPEEQTELLSGYVEIPPERWNLIKAGTYARYYSLEGEFRYGGVVHTNPFKYTPKGTEAQKTFLRFQSEFGATKTWSVAYEAMSRVFARPDAVTAVLMMSLETAVLKLNENIRKIAAHSQGLGERVAELERALDKRK